jgi:hypothetical protein
MLGQFGDVVGMTGYPEVVLARGDFLMLRIPLQGHQWGLRHEGEIFEPSRARGETK